METRGAGTRQRSFNDDWRAIETFTFKDVNWWECHEGIFDSRIRFPCDRSSEGAKLLKAFACCKSVLRQHPCEYKIGMARSLGIRWKMYMNSNEWRPTHLWLLLEVKGREAVGYAEAALIAMLKSEFPLEQSINWRSRDNGGTGPRRTADCFGDHYFVYRACKANTLLSHEEA